MGGATKSGAEFTGLNIRVGHYMREAAGSKLSRELAFQYIYDDGAPCLKMMNHYITGLYSAHSADWRDVPTPFCRGLFLFGLSMSVHGFKGFPMLCEPSPLAIAR